MESFSIHLTLNNSNQEILVIPDECTDNSIFHVVKNGSELCTLLYTDNRLWELMEEANIEPQEVEELGKKIEEHYL